MFKAEQTLISSLNQRCNKHAVALLRWVSVGD